MSVSIVVPFRSGCPQRERIWSFLRGRWIARFPDWQLITAEDDLGPWRKGLAVRRGIELSTGDIIAIVDADVWCDAVEQGVELACGGAPWVMPFTRVVRLTESATNQVLLGGDVAAIAGRRRSRAEPAYVQSAAGGMVILQRSIAFTVPIDERFTGWGQEDEAWRLALETLAGPRARVDASLLHLWHPPQERLTRSIGSREGAELRRRYSLARGNPDLMRDLVDGR